MSIQEILQSLCAYDIRNPESEIFDETAIAIYRNHVNTNPNYQCKCDNCYYGRTRLAEALLNTKEYENIVVAR